MNDPLLQSKAPSSNSSKEGEQFKPILDFEIKSRRFLLTSCHLNPKRSFYFRGKPILCFRCLGLNVGFFGGIILTSLITTFAPDDLIVNLLTNIGVTSLFMQFLFAILVQIPFILDGSLQALFDKYDSINPLRFITGLLGGLGQFLFIFSIGNLLKLLVF